MDCVRLRNILLLQPASLDTGRSGEQREIGQAARVTLELTEHLSGSGRHVTGDNFSPAFSWCALCLGVS